MELAATHAAHAVINLVVYKNSKTYPLSFTYDDLQGSRTGRTGGCGMYSLLLFLYDPTNRHRRLVTLMFQHSILAPANTVLLQ
jgi:hypothetical protein